MAFSQESTGVVQGHYASGASGCPLVLPWGHGAVSMAVTEGTEHETAGGGASEARAWRG